MLIVDDLIMDRVRRAATFDLSTDELLYTIRSIEEPSLQSTAEGEEVVDHIGALITTLYRAKKGTFSGSNSLFSLDVAAAQFGSEKEVAETGKTIPTPVFETFKVEEGTTEIKVKHTPIKDSIKYIYVESKSGVSTAYKAASAASDTECVVADDGTITLPTGLTGRVSVYYSYESENAVRVRNKVSEFPEACKLIIYAYFKDKCNENIVYSGSIVCPKAKMNPEQVELALTATGKHAFEFTMMQDYCDEDNELFQIIIHNDN